MNSIDPSSVTWPEQASIALIGMPVPVFFATWFQPMIGIPAAAISIWTSWRLMRSVSSSPLPPRSILLILALVAILWTWTTGLGGLFDQTWDHNFRNALLHDLIDHSWPVFWETPKGIVALDYYLSWSMIPALVGKILGWRAATLAMALFCATGVFLVMLLFVRIVGVWRWWIPFVFLLWSGLDIVGWGLRRQIPDVNACIEEWSTPIYYISHLLDYDNVAHLAIPSWIVTLLIVGRQIGPPGVVGLSAFLIPLAPFQAIGVAPFAVWGAFQGDGCFGERLRRILTVQNIATPLAFAALCVPLFLGNQGLGVGSGWFWKYEPPLTFSALVKYTAFWLLEILIPAGAIWLAGQRDRLVLLTVVVLCLIPLRRAGITNDLALKVSVPALLILSLYAARAFVSKVEGWPKWLLIGIVGLGAVTPLHLLWVETYFTITDPSEREKDHIRTFDPAQATSAFEQKYLVNFRSHALVERPVLRNLLARVPDPLPRSSFSQ
jgi:hypothetical protein